MFLYSAVSTLNPAKIRQSYHSINETTVKKHTISRKQIYFILLTPDIHRTLQKGWHIIQKPTICQVLNLLSKQCIPTCIFGKILVWTKDNFYIKKNCKQNAFHLVKCQYTPIAFQLIYCAVYEPVRRLVSGLISPACAGLLWEENTVSWLISPGWNKQANMLIHTRWKLNWVRSRS